MKTLFTQQCIASNLARLAICLCLLTSCNLAKRIPGTYSSKFASNGFFITHLDLWPDSGFFYQFSGDMISNIGVGTYRTRNRDIQLTYTPSKYDSLTFGIREDTVWGQGKKSFRIDTIGVPIKVLNESLVNSRPTMFYYKCNKIYGRTADGKIFNMKGFVFSPRRKYLLFGTHYFSMRNPMKRRHPKDIA